MTSAHVLNPSEHLVAPADEQRHTPDADDLWNESYYADFVQADGSLGGWLRLGLYPNRQVAWWTTWIVGPDRTGICSVNYTVPVPAGMGLVTEANSGADAEGDAEHGAIRIELDLRSPLKEFRIAASAPADAYERPEAVYAGESGEATRLGVDLTWTTDGTPYHYDLTTRYEIPCTVAGTITIGDTECAIAGQGQRDHSWGVRDWWALGWCWSSARLDDGTRVHFADIRSPEFPIAFGYVQTPAPGLDGSTRVGGVHPVTELSVSEEIGEHGFPASARLAVVAAAGLGDAPASNAPASNAPAPLAITVVPLAFGPVLLRNDDGRISRFPRAMVRYEADDGRNGLGWIEWNQPQPE